MRRGLWFLAGTAAGVWTSVRARRAAESMTVDGLQDRLQGLAAGARVLRDEVAAGRAEKETDVRARLSLVSDESTGATSGETPEITTGKVDD
jgi:hypothetical protein